MTDVKAVPESSIDPDVSSGVAQFLAPIVVDLQALAIDGKQAHWHVRGANFQAVHELLDVVGLTVFLVVAMGTVTGAMLPLGFKRLGLDPALMSNPLIAAFVDVVGVVIYYGVARAALSDVAGG